MNYSNGRNKSAPIKGGRLSDVVRPRKRLFTRVLPDSTTATANELKADLVQALADMGIVISNVHSLARQLVEKGWARVKKIEKDI